MDAHAISTLQARQLRRERGRLTVSTIVRTGAIAGLAGGIVMAMWQMIVGAVAQEPTAVTGIHQSFWTAVTSIPSVVLGPSWFHGGFEAGAVVVGLIAHMMNSIMLGIVGVGLATTLLGRRPSVAQMLAFGMAFGVVLQLAIVDGLINGVLQSVHTLSTATPAWSWWVAHVMFGAMFGLVAAALLRWRAD
jgi:hypothetical protein